MSTTVDASPGRQRRRLRWLLAGVVLAALLLAGGIAIFRAGHDSGELPAHLRTELTGRLVPLLEQSLPDEDFPAGLVPGFSGTVLCAVDPFAVDPAGTAGIAQVRTVYAIHLCVVAMKGTSWDFSTKVSGPVAVRLSQPAEVHVAKPGRGYPDRVRVLIPDQYQKRALGPFTDRPALDKLRDRFNAIAG
jgi:hypothetical protein